MQTVFINNLAVTLPSRFVAGQKIGENAANILQAIWVKRISSRLRGALDRGELDAQTIQGRANAIAAEDLTPYTSADDFDSGDNDPVMQEALSMARDMINQRMAQEGLPPPKGLELHARALVDQMPALLDRARQRVEARYQAATTILPLG